MGKTAILEKGLTIRSTTPTHTCPRRWQSREKESEIRFDKEKDREKIQMVTERSDAERRDKNRESTMDVGSLSLFYRCESVFERRQHVTLRDVTFGASSPMQISTLGRATRNDTSFCTVEKTFKLWCLLSGWLFRDRGTLQGSERVARKDPLCLLNCLYSWRK